MRSARLVVLVAAALCAARPARAEPPPLKVEFGAVNRTVFEHLHELPGLQHRVVRPGVEPCHAAAHHFNLQLASFKIEAIQVGDFQFAAFRRLQRVGETHNEQGWWSDSALATPEGREPRPPR